MCVCSRNIKSRRNYQVCQYKRLKKRKVAPIVRLHALVNFLYCITRKKYGAVTIRIKYQIRTRDILGPMTNSAQSFNYLQLLEYSNVYKIFDKCWSS